jgi:hypothetical protein
MPRGQGCPGAALKANENPAQYVTVISFQALKRLPHPAIRLGSAAAKKDKDSTIPTDMIQGRKNAK